MRPPSEEQAVSRIIELLADLLGASVSIVHVEHVGVTEGYDFAVVAAGYRFIAEYKTTASGGPVAMAINQLNRYAQRVADAGFPLLVVPYMGQVGRQLCDRAHVSWFDLSGNAKIILPGQRVWIEGRPNKYRERGRPANVFAAKSSRIARQLLLQPMRFQTQAELAYQTGLGDGYVSRIVRRLREEHYLDANEGGAVRPRDPDLLLDAWHDVYGFHRHRIIQGHVPARSGDELLQRVVQAMSGEKAEWAVTGLSAAWLYTGFASFRLVTVFLSSTPTRSVLERLEFSEESAGANLWFVLPEDEGVFHGSQLHEGVRCVSAVQTYLDLKGLPERAKDAAVELRKRLLNWGQHGT